MKMEKKVNKVRLLFSDIPVPVPVELQESIIDMYVNHRAFLIQRYWKKVSLSKPVQICFLCGRKSKFLHRFKGCSHPQCLCSLHVCHHNKCTLYSRFRPYILQFIKYWISSSMIWFLNWFFCCMITIIGFAIFYLL